MTIFDEDQMSVKRQSPEELSEEERDREIAALFARGILRLQQQEQLTPSQELSKSAPEGLEFPRPTRLSVSSG